MFFSAIGILLWIAFLIAVLVLSGIIWAAGNLILWVLDLKPLPNQRSGRQKPPVAPAVGPRRNVPPAPAARSVPRVPAPVAPPTQAGPDIWPKWTPSHRLYKARELSLWQEQFDALDSRG
ncbi:hypothetical protein [Pseudarthrobacter sp. NamE5]|uniref:hypothetical protein n=1 Tax=Pseudarthrobacter sp. NamE5 TaxID=2576839 RepID=UPI00110BEE21|nr:hypothetical protein [Pseudarthrobacter sp. NamE5]TLM86049.1 hypothetical protein FDW84_07190 [Pseudarthrobacter sp. NamE5]